MTPSLNAIHEFMAQENIAIISDKIQSGNFSFSLQDQLNRCGYNVRHIRPRLSDFDDEGRCLCIASLPPAFSALILDLHPAAASVIMDEAILKGIGNIWLLPRSYNCILREKGTDNRLNLIYKENILNYLEKPSFLQRLQGNYMKHAISAFARR